MQVDQNGAVQLAMADLSDEIQPVNISHLPRLDFELYIIDLFNMVICAIDMDVCNLHDLDMLPMCSLNLTERENKGNMFYAIYDNCRII